jgi:pSer/pThr/pTyr-binding forkhead associated (FHA) protein
VVIDLESRNGTFVNGVRVMQRHPLNHRDVITIGRAHLKFHAYGYTPPRPADPGAALLMPARTKAAMDGRALTRQQPNRPLPTPKVASNDSTLSSSPGDTISSDRSIAFTRPPARPIIKPQDEDER